MQPTKEVNETYELFCFAALADDNENKIYSDLAGKFPVCSFSGQQYIFVAYTYGPNAILVHTQEKLHVYNKHL